MLLKIPDSDDLGSAKKSRPENMKQDGCCGMYVPLIIIYSNCDIKILVIVTNCELNMLISNKNCNCAKRIDLYSKYNPCS